MDFGRLQAHLLTIGARIVGRHKGIGDTGARAGRTPAVGEPLQEHHAHVLVHADGPAAHVLSAGNEARAAVPAIAAVAHGAHLVAHLVAEGIGKGGASAHALPAHAQRRSHVLSHKGDAMQARTASGKRTRCMETTR